MTKDKMAQTSSQHAASLQLVVSNSGGDGCAQATKRPPVSPTQSHELEQDGLRLMKAFMRVEDRSVRQALIGQAEEYARQKKTP